MFTLVAYLFSTSPPIKVQSIAMSMSARLSKKLHIQTLRHFLYMLSVAVARSSGDNTIRYLLLVLWMT